MKVQIVIFWVLNVRLILQAVTKDSEKHDACTSSILKMEAACFSETLVTSHKTILCRNPEVNNLGLAGSKWHTGDVLLRVQRPSAAITEPKFQAHRNEVAPFSWNYFERIGGGAGRCLASEFKRLLP
jgi:hypothetical protein